MDRYDIRLEKLEVLFTMTNIFQGKSLIPVKKKLKTLSYGNLSYTLNWKCPKFKDKGFSKFLNFYK